MISEELQFPTVEATTMGWNPSEWVSLIPNGMGDIKPMRFYNQRFLLGENKVFVDPSFDPMLPSIFRSLV